MVQVQWKTKSTRDLWALATHLWYLARWQSPCCLRLASPRDQDEEQSCWLHLGHQGLVASQHIQHYAVIRNKDAKTYDLQMFATLFGRLYFSFFCGCYTLSIYDFMFVCNSSACKSRISFTWKKPFSESKQQHQNVESKNVINVNQLNQLSYPLAIKRSTWKIVLNEGV